MPDAKKPARRVRRPTPGAVAAHHRQTRRAHSAELAEDYVELISTLEGAGSAPRVVDLAAALGVSHVTVVRTIARLARDGLVVAQSRRPLALTLSGRRLADRAKRRHEVVVSFLRALGVSERAALADAEGIEHHVSKETLMAFERFVGRSNNAVGGERPRPLE